MKLWSMMGILHSISTSHYCFLLQYILYHHKSFNSLLITPVYKLIWVSFWQLQEYYHLPTSLNYQAKSVAQMQNYCHSPDLHLDWLLFCLSSLCSSIFLTGCSVSFLANFYPAALKRAEQLREKSLCISGQQELQAARPHKTGLNFSA